MFKLLYIFLGVAGDGEIKLDSTNFPDTVVWNPWNEKVIEGLNFEKLHSAPHVHILQRW